MTTSCPCGSFVFPKDTTLKINNSTTATFLHTNRDILVSAGQKFKTITSEITANDPQSYLISFGSPILLENQIKITIKSYSLDKILAIAFLGNLDQTVALENIKIYNDNIVLSTPLSNDRIVLEIESICQEINETCCDKLPSSLSVSCILDPCEICIPVNDPTSTTIAPSTTTTPAPGSCCDLNIGDTGYISINIQNTNQSCPDLFNFGSLFNSGGIYTIVSDQGWINGLRTYYIRIIDDQSCFWVDGILTCSTSFPYWDSVINFGSCLLYTNIDTAFITDNTCNNTAPSITVTGTGNFELWGCNYQAYSNYLRSSCGRYEIRASVQPCCANGLVLCHEIPQCAPDNYFCVPPNECGYTYSIPYNDDTCYVQRQTLGDGSLQCPEGWFYDSVNNTCYYRQCDIPNDLPESIQYTRDCGNGPEQLTSYNITWIDTANQ